MEQKLVFTEGKQTKRNLSHRFNNLDWLKIKALAYIHGFKYSRKSKSIIINNQTLNLRKVNGYLYADYTDLQQYMDRKVESMVNIYRKTERYSPITAE